MADMKRMSKGERGAHAAVAKVQVDGRIVDRHAVAQRGAQALLLEHGAGALCARQSMTSRVG